MHTVCSFLSSITQFEWLHVVSVQLFSYYWNRNVFKYWPWYFQVDDLRLDTMESYPACCAEQNTSSCSAVVVPPMARQHAPRHSPTRVSSSVTDFISAPGRGRWQNTSTGHAGMHRVHREYKKGAFVEDGRWVLIVDKQCSDICEGLVGGVGIVVGVRTSWS